MLGVCRGAQVINVAHGRHALPGHRHAACRDALNHRNWAIYEENCHATSLVPGSGLARLYPGTPLVKTNSIHHQAVKDLGRDLVVEAWSEPDRIVEAIRWTGPVVPLRRAVAPRVPRRRATASFIDDTPILDDFLAAAARHKAAAFAL